MDQPQWRRVLSFPNILTGLFLVAVLIQLHHHVMWRDEIRTWQICREATGLVSLWELMKFDAVPFLWNWIVFALTRITDNPAAMQIAHGFIAASVVYVVARWAPFPKLSRTLFAFGYFPFFEYAVLSRSYALLFLLLMIACVLISRLRVPLQWLTLDCCLMAQVSIWGVGFAILFFLTGAAKARWNKQAVPVPWNQLSRGLGILILSIVICLAQLFPGPGPSFRGQWQHYTMLDRFLFTLGTVYRAYAPIPEVVSWLPYPKLYAHFWNTNILDIRGPLMAPIGVALFGFAALVLMRRPLALGLFACGTIGLLAFAIVSFQGYNRHFGHLFMVLIASFWLAEASPIRLQDWAQSIRKWSLCAMLGLQSIIGVVVACAGLSIPFSATQAVADYIRTEPGLNDNAIVLVAVNDTAASPISQWLNKPIYYPQEKRFGRYYTQNDQERFPDTKHTGDILNAIYDAALSKGQFAILLLNSNLKLPYTRTDSDVDLTFTHNGTGEQITVRMETLAGFDKSVVEDEAHQLYLFALPRQVGGNQK